MGENSGYHPRRHLSGKTHWCWVASYHGKYSTKKRSHILLSNCFLKNIKIYRGVRSTGSVPKQVRAYVPMCRSSYGSAGKNGTKQSESRTTSNSKLERKKEKEKCVSGQA